MPNQPDFELVTHHFPIGHLEISTDGVGITHIRYAKADQGKASGLEHPILKECICQLEAYFDGKRTAFDLPVYPPGTEFQQGVWKVIQKIPFGRTRSYLDVARQLGDGKKIRAVGQANGKNPIPIIIPCHRIVGSDGSLTGYSGGLPKKKWLLDFERPDKQGRFF